MSILKMMMEKPNIMYATIKGSLTENDGVFSGFSGANYLALQEPFKINADTVAEFVFKINISSIASGYSFFGTLNSYGLLISMSNAGRLSLYIGDGSSWNIASGILTTSVLSTDTDYFVKLIFNKQSVSLLISTDGIAYTGATTTITLNQEYVYDLCYGIGRATGTYFRGSIDLNRSYIKLGSTKYNLQAVVGWTKVGSPTITDGVVSGFQAYPNVNSGYYVKIANFTYNNTFEMKVKIKTDSANFGGTVLGQGNPAPRAGIGSTSFRESNFTLQLTDQNNQSIVNIVNVNYIGSRQITLNTDYILSLKFTGTEYIITLVDMNGIYYINRVISSSAKLRVGCLAFGINYADVAYSAWSGAIDMNETWIKTDNKLFFNGQPS